VAILHIEDSSGRIIEQYQPLPGDQVISPQHAYLITDILADNKARAGVFGQNNPLKLSRPAAAKTGTTDDYRDAWTLGYTPELVTGVWVGNADNTPMKEVAGARGAAPIWHNFMERALADQPASQFPRPEGIEEIEISSAAGSLPSSACPPDQRRTEIFAAGQGPLGAEYDLHQNIRIDTSTSGLATDYCPADVVAERYFYVLPGPEGQKWAEKHNIPQPPANQCPAHTGPAQVALLQPSPGETVADQVYIMGQAAVPDFDYYVVEYGEGQDPIGWGAVTGPVYAPIDSGLLAVWDVSPLANRDYTVRVVVYNHQGYGVESRTWVFVQNAEPIWTPVPTDTPAPTWTLAPVASVTPVPTWTPAPADTPPPTPTFTPTFVPTFTDTPTPTETAVPTDTPLPTDTPTVLPLPTWTTVPTVTILLDLSP
jgi:hypothetical protein